MKTAALIFLTIFSIYSYAGDKPWVAWLIYPANKNSAAVEMWPNNKGFIWKLLTHENELLTSIQQPETPDGYTYNQGGCSIDGTYRWDVIVSIKHRPDRPTSNDYYQVWVPSPEEKSFKLIHPKTVECTNEGYGI
ncbi:hypothetical protein [Shewanella sp.]|uniref:hypothetical protein n=1 Tax=Shewanella sp. TaxID=50422 RepID=UPI0035698433